MFVIYLVEKRYNQAVEKCQDNGSYTDTFYALEENKSQDKRKNKAGNVEADFEFFKFDIKVF